MYEKVFADMQTSGQYLKQDFGELFRVKIQKMIITDRY